MTQKSLIKMQISTKKNQNLEKPSRNPSIRTIVKILKKNFVGYLSKKIWFRICSVTVEMFELRNSGKNRRKLSKIFFENLPRAFKDLIEVKKKSKISHACVPLRCRRCKIRRYVAAPAWIMKSLLSGPHDGRPLHCPRPVLLHLHLSHRLHGRQRRSAS